MPETSVIIRAFNEADYIGDVLEAVENQNYQDFEIILVDSGSTDGTVEIAEKYVDVTEFVSPKNFTFGYSCNVGCRAASGEFCSFISAHAIPTDNQWLGTMIENLYEEEVAMTYSNQVGEKTTKYSEHRLFNELFPEQRRRQTPPDYWANNASSAIKKNLWEDHQFNEYLTGHEDIEWAKHFMDQGYVVIYESEACIYHIHDETWDHVFNRFKREAIADVEIGIKDPSDRWNEYLNLPKDILSDTVAAIKDKKISLGTIAEIIQFRYNQHIGTVSGLLSEPDLEANRQEYYYGDANKSVNLDSTGTISFEQNPLPDIKPNEVLIKTEYVGVGPGASRLIDEDKYTIVSNGNFVGTVVELGANANSVNVGDRIVGDTRFHCGVCSACNGNNHEDCKNPTVLGLNTDFTAYSRYISIPSDYACPLPDDIDGCKGTLARIVAAIFNQVGQLGVEGNRDTKCVVVGDTANAKLAVQVIELMDEHSATHISEWPLANESESADLSEYDVVIEAVGSTESARRCILKASQGSSILLLGVHYERFNLTIQDVFGKTIQKLERNEPVNFSAAIDILSQIECDKVLNGTYDLTEFEEAQAKADNNQRYSVISPNSGSGSK